MVSGFPQWGQTGSSSVGIFIFSCRSTISRMTALVIKGFLTARLTALEQAVIALRVKQPLFIKARLLKAVIHVGRDNKIIFVLYQLQKVLIDRLGRIHIAVDVDIPAPIRPMLLRRGKGIKAAGVHIPNSRTLPAKSEKYFSNRSPV